MSTDEGDYVEVQFPDGQTLEVRRLSKKDQIVTDIELPMVCTCSQEGRDEARELLVEVKQRLSKGSEALGATTITDSNFLTSVVTSLHVDFHTHIGDIYTDMWSSVSASTYDKETTVHVMCDEVEHGIAAIWKHFADA